MRWIARRFRLIPAVMALSSILFAIKAASLVHEARAQDGPHIATGIPQSQTRESASDPAAEDAETTSADVDVLTSLSKRRAELDTRERDLEMRQNLLAATEKRVDEKIASLKALQDQIKSLVGQRDDAAQKELVGLVKTYSSMKPRDAGRIFNNLSDDVLVPVASAMKPDVLGAILAQMDSEAAQKLTVKLAARFAPPDTKSAPGNTTAPTAPATQAAATAQAVTVAKAAAPASTQLVNGTPSGPGTPAPDSSNSNK